MKVRIHRGASEIGGSCVEIEAGGESILIDAGMPLAGFPEPSQGLPNLDSRLLHGIVISHPHQDHYGLLPWMPSVPVLMGSTARRILQAAAPFMRQAALKLDGPDLMSDSLIQHIANCRLSYRVISLKLEGHVWISTDDQ